MGTIFDQPDKYPRFSLKDEAESVLSAAKKLSKDEKITFEQALRCVEIAQKERWLSFAYTVHNTLDEQIAWAAKLWCAKNRVSEQGYAVDSDED
jgi:hypothetical protein